MKAIYKDGKYELITKSGDRLSVEAEEFIQFMSNPRYRRDTKEYKAFSKRRKEMAREAIRTLSHICDPCKLDNPPHQKKETLVCLSDDFQSKEMQDLRGLFYKYAPEYM